MLPSEALLDAFQFLDYNAVAVLKFASSLLRDVAQKYIEQYQTTAKNMVVIIEENALRVFCPAKKKSLCRVLLCHRAENYSTCDDWSCSTVHIAEAAVKFRALLGFSRVDHVEIHADWNDTMMKRLLTFVPMLKSARMITLGQRAGGQAAVALVPLQPQQMLWPPTPWSRVGSTTLLSFIGYFEDVATLWVHGVDEATFDWTILRDPRLLNLTSLRMMNLREEPNVEEVVR
ncbi:hypothetical protein AAVH_35314 [Aphelenchoides avenae]|nr:hypothetical protein AAVH_35314 [Aphelenchus avenae]